MENLKRRMSSVEFQLGDIHEGLRGKRAADSKEKKKQINGPPQLVTHLQSLYLFICFLFIYSFIYLFIYFIFFWGEYIVLIMTKIIITVSAI